MAEVRENHAKCYAVSEVDGDGKPIRVCTLLFQDLRNRRDSVYVEVSGYVAYIGGLPYLFPSRDAYIYTGGKGGVALAIPLPEKKRFKRLVRADSTVTVAGLYSPGAGSGNGGLGQLEVIGRHYWLQELPGDKPQLPID
ncbi:hypothetical protein [Stenotrophomonas muris]|uniref:hypothetical protein n=1 Tax=Stenotrophomonas muris TaxID=2963283 RepID=UPI001F53CB7E|nr:hypothetical protein [uncultured Stenotrophomonas sp.]MCI1145614.1 hypothetical protein [Stenotrophomonas maltophilia]